MWLSALLLLSAAPSDDLTGAFLETCAANPAWILEDSAEGWVRDHDAESSLPPDEAEANYIETPNAAWTFHETDMGLTRSMLVDGNFFGPYWVECSVSALTGDSHYAGPDDALSGQSVRETLSHTLAIGDWAETGPGIEWSLHSTRLTDPNHLLETVDVFEAAYGDTVFIRVAGRARNPIQTLHTDHQEDQ